MPATAFSHFQQDIARVRAIVVHAGRLPIAAADERLLRSDLLRSAWTFAVGALDAYFCDAYTDVVAATIISKSRQPSMTLPEFFYDIKFPVRSILESYTINENWRWRMAAREMMRRETVLRLERIQDLFNRFFPPGRKFFRDLLHDWISRSDAKKRLFGITSTAYQRLPAGRRQKAMDDAWDQMKERYRSIFQRRHDCVHNCDRPRVSPQRLSREGTVLKVIQDVEFLVERCDEHVRLEFRVFLQSLGCPATLITQVGY